MPKQLIPASVSAPAFYGLNTQRKADILPFQWATKADNCVVDDSGRIACRKGSQKSHTTAVAGSPDIEQIFEYKDGSGNLLNIFAADNKIFKIVSGTVTDISGTITTPTANNWKFQNFNSKCIGFQSGHAPVVLATNGGSFADITVASGTASANEALSAFGRMWILDGTSLKYSASLDETHWTTGAGSFDLSTVWLSGMDNGVALAEFNGHLVVFGNDSIIVYNNPWVPTGTGAIDATTMSLVENIGGIGCIARDSVQHMGTDILFLSNQGVRSLGRTIQEKSMPVNDVSKNVSDELNALVKLEVKSDIRSGYSKTDGFYVISLPTANVSYYFDLRFKLQDGSYKTTKWLTSYKAIHVASDNEMYLGTAGFISTYSGYLDGIASDGTGGSTYDWVYESGWNDLSSEGQNLSSMNKIPKKISVLLLGGGGQDLNVKWAFDFIDNFSSFSKTLGLSSTTAEYGIAEFNIGEYSGGQSYSRATGTMSKSGQFIKLGVQMTINGGLVALQQIDTQSKIGRLSV